MRDYVLFQAQRIDTGHVFTFLRRLYANWRKRQRLRHLEHLDDRALDDIGLTRADVMATFKQPMSVDPIWELERRAMLHRNRSLRTRSAG